jgi:tetratricopeptide (TPR) repeat protein
MLPQSEAQSRSGFVGMLQSIGFSGQGVNDNPQLQVPPAVEERLWQMTFPEQFAAVRELHRLMRQKGESPQIVGALVRGYANMGVLSENLWDASHKVFKARALLYAQRLIAKDAKSPWGYWHRAYAMAMAGRHGDALKDLEMASQSKGAATEPVWIDLITALCRFDNERLKEMATKDPAQAQLAQMLRFYAVESLSAQHLTLVTAQEVLEGIPECYRIHESLAEVGGVNTQHVTTLLGMESFSRHVPGRLTHLAALPKSTAGLLAKEAEEPAVWKSLLAAGQPRSETGEPSWAILGHWGQESRFVQVSRRAFFMHYLWSVPVDEFLAEVRPWVADHRYARLLDLFVMDQRDQAQRKQLLEKLPLDDVDCRYAAFVYALNRDHPEWWEANWSLITGRSDSCYQDWVWRMRVAPPKLRANVGQMIPAISPFAPMGIASLIEEDDVAWRKESTAMTTTWEKESPHAEVFQALAKRYQQENRPDDAVRCWKRAAEISPDAESQRQLAKLYKKQGQEELWLKTMEAILDQPDLGLEHAQIGVELARHFMKRRDFERAKPYAAEAAESWAGWAMDCARECYEGLNDWENAELWVRRISERYENSYSDWFFWCVRNGKGDAESALRLMAEKTNNFARLNEDERFFLALHYLLAGRPEKAPDLLYEMKDAQVTGTFKLLAIVTWDGLGSRQKRDQALASFPAKTEYTALVELFRNTLSRGEKADIDAKAIDKALEPMGDKRKRYSYYFVAKFLEARGQTAEIVRYLRLSADFSPEETKKLLVPLLPMAELRARGIDPMVPKPSSKEKNEP